MPSCTKNGQWRSFVRYVRAKRHDTAEGEFDAIRGVVLIQGNLGIGTTTHVGAKSWRVLDSGT